jgi:hypothetical protein
MQGAQGLARDLLGGGLLAVRWRNQAIRLALAMGEVVQRAGLAFFVMQILDCHRSRIGYTASVPLYVASVIGRRRGGYSGILLFHGLCHGLTIWCREELRCKVPPIRRRPVIPRTYIIDAEVLMLESRSPLEADRAKLRAAERCQSVRRLCELEVSCRAVGDKITTYARGVVRNVSAQGICLHVSSRFEVGRLLALELPGASGSGGRRLLAYLIRVAPAAEGHWELGCTFTSRLSDEELRTLFC